MNFTTPQTPQTPQRGQDNITLFSKIYTMASMSKCARPGCFQTGSSRCSSCLREPYCTGDCQKIDWKAHKLICKTLKKLSDQLQPYRIVVQAINEILESGNSVRVLEHLLLYAEFQFGDRILRNSYRVLFSDRISNYDVEIDIIYQIYKKIIGIYASNQSMSMIVRNKALIPYMEKVLELLAPWSVLIDSDDAIRMNSLNIDQIDHVLLLLSGAERSLASVYTHGYKIKLAESHCKRALSYASRYKGEAVHKTALSCNAYKSLCELSMMQDDYTKAVNFAEEAYNCVAMAYNPVHPEVQSAACMLIECLIHKGNLFDAERFSQLTLDSLKDPANAVDQNSEVVATGYYNLGKVINAQKGDLVKAEMLVREAYRIRVQLYDNNHYLVGISANLLANILMSKGKYGDETKKLFERFLATSIRNEGPDSANAASGNTTLGRYHYLLAKMQLTADTKKEQLYLARSYYVETVRIWTKVYGSTNSKTIEYVSILSDITLELSKA